MRASASPLTATTIDCRFEFILSRKLILLYLFNAYKGLLFIMGWFYNKIKLNFN